MKKLPIILSSVALSSIAAIAPMTSSYAAEYGTPERAAEVAYEYYHGKREFTDTSDAWCVKFALKCIKDAGGIVPGISESEASTTHAIVTMYKADPNSYHSWETEYWSYAGRENPKSGDQADTDYTPKVGDLVFFDNLNDEDVGPGPDHTGLVVAVEGTGQSAEITTIEGNISDSIITATYKGRVRKSGPVGSNTVIIGFGSPIYPNNSATPSVPEKPANSELAESPIKSSPNSRQRAIEQSYLRQNKSKRPENYDKYSITFVDEVLKASGAKSFYIYPEVPHISDFVSDYNKNGAYFESSSSYVPRVGDIAAIENNGDSGDGADQLAIVSGVNYDGNKKEVYIIKYDPVSDKVCDSELCTDTILGFCVPFYEYDDLGDVTYDGRVDTNDVIELMELVTSHSSGYPTYLKLCSDINKNDNINKIDYTDLQKKLSKQIVIESETDQSSKVGKKESDRITATVSDEKGYMVYGPYVKGLSLGDKEAIFRMKTDNNTADNDVVAKIEVQDSDLGGIIASKEIRRKDFITPDAYQDFRLEYENISLSHKIEYRVYYYQKALISVDSVSVRDVSVKTDMVYEAESDLKSQIREKGADGKYGRDGIEGLVSDNPGYLAYGPYVDKLALGTFRADFSLKVDNNTIDSDVLKIDVYNTTKDQVLAQQTIKCTDFEKANFTQIFSLYFNNTQLNDVYEFRTYYYGNSETIIDKVSVSKLDKLLANEFTADDMKMSEGCTKDGTQIKLGKSGDVVYGPYTNKITLGKNNAIFKVDISGEGDSDDVVAVFDVFTADNDNFFAKKELKRSEIVSDGCYHLTFDIPTEYVNSKIEFRISATGKADLAFNKVIVTSEKTATKSSTLSNNVDPSLLNTTSRKVLMNGVDVSNPGQHRNINWDVLKNNVDFAIIRIGDASVNEGDFLDDSFEFNYSEARRVGMKIGGYWFLRATTVEGAKEEARICLEFIKGKNFEFPVYLDIEDDNSIQSGCINEMATAFCEEIKAAGYTPGIYVNKRTLLERMDESLFSKYALWYAQYYSVMEYDGPAGMWQYSETGRVDGISVDVDLDYCYVDYPSIIG